MKKDIRFHACLFLALLTLPIASLLAVDHYVSPTGGNISAYTNWANAATNIQTALDVAVDGETVWVTNGTYSLPATIIVSTAVTLKSAHGYHFTALNGRNTIRALIISNAYAVVDGFMISNCVAADGLQGGAVLISDNGGTLRNCFVCSNRQAGPGWYGGGVAIVCSNGLIESCIISNNNSLYRGGGVGLMGPVTNGGGILRNSLIINNTCDYQGAGVYCLRWGLVDNCTVVGNTTTASLGGIMMEANSGFTGVLCNSISYLNVSGGDSNLSIYGGCFVSNSCWGGTATPDGSGYIKVNPQFVNPAAGNYRLSPGSPCLNAGINETWMTNAVDLDGHRRLDRFRGQVDMGCYEYLFKGSMLEVR